MINIRNNCNIGILFQPRSGSHVLQYYLMEILSYKYLGELFNAFQIDNNFNTLPMDSPEKYNIEFLSNLLDTRLEFLNNSKKYGVYKVLVESYMDLYPKFSDRLRNESNSQFIRLERKNVFYSIVSRYISEMTGLWHNLDARTAQKRPDIKFVMHKKQMISMLKNYVDKNNHMTEYFSDVPTIFYEDFEYCPADLRKLFTGIPSKIISIPMTKFLGNHTNLIENIEEIKDCYREFVYKQPTYFSFCPEV